MTDVADTHSDVAAAIADAVSELTRRAVAPTLEPFHEVMRQSTRQLDTRAATIDAACTDLSGAVESMDGRLNRRMDRQDAAAQEGRERLEAVAAAVTGQLAGLAQGVRESATRTGALAVNLTRLDEGQQALAEELHAVPARVQLACDEMRRHQRLLVEDVRGMVERSEEQAAVREVAARQALGADLAEARQASAAAARTAGQVLRIGVALSATSVALSLLLVVLLLYR